MQDTGVKLYRIDPSWAREIKTKSGTTDRIATGFISTPDEDMAHDIVLPETMNDQRYFKNTRSVNLNHVGDNVVGTNRRLEKMPGKGVYAHTQFGTHSLGEDVWRMIKEEIIRGASIEYDTLTVRTSDPTESERNAYGSGAKQVFRYWDLLGYAFTARPCNPNAVIDGFKSMDMKDTAWVAAMTPTWEAMEGLMRAGKIHRSSAVAAGLPDSPGRKVFAVTTPNVRKVLVLR